MTEYAEAWARHRPDAQAVEEQEQVERVALAIWATTMRDGMTWWDWEHLLIESDREFYREQARAAITAMRAEEAS